MTTETSNTIAKTLISPVLMKRNDCSIPQKNKKRKSPFHDLSISKCTIFECIEIDSNRSNIRCLAEK